MATDKVGFQLVIQQKDAKSYDSRSYSLSLSLFLSLSFSLIHTFSSFSLAHVGNIKSVTWILVKFVRKCWACKLKTV